MQTAVNRICSTSIMNRGRQKKKSPVIPSRCNKLSLKMYLGEKTPNTQHVMTMKRDTAEITHMSEPFRKHLGQGAGDLFCIDTVNHVKDFFDNRQSKQSSERPR